MAKEADQNVHITVFDFGSGEEWQLNRRLSDPRGVSEGQWRGVFEKLKKEYVKPDCDREDIDMIIPKSGNE
jgi:glutamate formiminotransferase